VDGKEDGAMGLSQQGREVPPVALTRRQLLRGVGGLALGGVAASTLSSCGSAGALSGLSVAHRQAGSLDYWNLFGGGDGVRMEAMEAGFRKKYPSIGLTAVTLAWGNPYYTKLSLATLGRKPPDVAVSHLTRMKTLVAANLVEELTPAHLASVGITADKIAQRPWQAAQVDGKIYAVPLDTHPIVMFYNTKVCKKAGLLDSNGKLAPMDSPQAFKSALQKAKKVTGQAGAVIAITNETATPWRVFQSLYSQLGGKMLADQGTKIVIDQDKAMKVLELMQSLSKQNLIPSRLDYQGSIAMFANGDAGFLFQGEWEITTFQTAKTPFSMTLFPNVYGGPNGYAVQADSHTLLVPKQPVNDPTRFHHSLQFIRSMLDQSKTWAEGGHIPAWLPFRDSAAYKHMTPQSNYASAADSAVYDPPAWYSGSGSIFEIVVGSVIGGVVAGQITPASAIKQMRSKLGSLAHTAPPT
jgi:multiple sugar transport system substrate-binding protein